MQLGPMSLFLIRSTLRSGWAVGLSIGAGIAVVDALYAAAGAAGAASLLAIDPLRTTLSLVGAAVLLFLGIRTLRDAFRVRLGAGDRVRGRDAAAGIRHLGRGDGVEPVDDRVLGGGVRRRFQSAPPAGRRCWSPVSASAASAGSAPGHRHPGSAPRARHPRDVDRRRPRGRRLIFFGCAWPCQPTQRRAEAPPRAAWRDRDRAAHPSSATSRRRIPPRRARGSGASPISA